MEESREKVARAAVHGMLYRLLEVSRQSLEGRGL